MPTEWMKNLEKDLRSVAESEIREIEPTEDYPEKRAVLGILGDEICRILALKNRYTKRAVTIGEELENLHRSGKGETRGAVKLESDLRKLGLDINVLEGIFNASLYTAFPELLEKPGVLIALGWKVVAIDAEIIVRDVSRSGPSTNNN